MVEFAVLITIPVHQYNENQTHFESKCIQIKCIEKCDIQVVIKVFAVIMNALSSTS